MTDLLFGISTLLIVLHVCFAGVYLYTREQCYKIHVIICGVFTLLSLGLLPFTFRFPVVWSASFAMLFVYASIFHYFYQQEVKNDYIKEYCNFKIYIELCGVILGICELIILLVFPNSALFVAILGLYFILKLNYYILLRKRIYQVKYENATYNESAKVSIVIIAYNEEKFIRSTLETIQQQDYKNFEVIIVDDHSTDSTVAVATEFTATLPLRVVQKPIRGISRSRNYGATFATGDIILFIDADVLLSPNFISTNLQSFKDQRLVIAGVDFMPTSEKLSDKYIIVFYRLWLRLVQYYNPRGIGFCLFVKKAIHQKVLFDESIVMSEDFDYVRRASAFGKFRILTAVPIQASWRRFHNENRFILILKYLFFEFYRQNIGEIRKKIVSYEFGEHNNINKHC